MFPIVDEHGNIISAATRGECHNGSKLLHPVVHLHVFNSQGEIYLQKRPDWKDIQPGKWDTAVGGHVDLCESVEIALKREVQEELGITDFTPELLTTYVFESDREKGRFNPFLLLYNEEKLDEAKRSNILNALTVELIELESALDLLTKGEGQREVFSIIDNILPLGMPHTAHVVLKCNGQEQKDDRSL